MDLPTTIDAIRALHGVPMVDRDQLPSSPGIYFVTLDGERVVYIGRSHDMQFRWKLHHRFPEIEERRARVHWLVVADVDLLPGIEARLIRRFQPDLNRQLVQHGSAKRPRVELRADGAILDERDLLKQPKVKAWAARKTNVQPQSLKLYTYVKRGGCCSYCGEALELRQFFTSPSYDESPPRKRDLFGRYLICRSCLSSLRKRADQPVSEEQKKELLRNAVSRVEHAFSALARFGHYSKDLERFLEMSGSIVIKFKYEEEANKAPEPTTTAVTPPADAGVAPAVVVAHLSSEGVRLVKK